jgi:hypothetical protein
MSKPSATDLSWMTRKIVVRSTVEQLEMLCRITALNDKPSPEVLREVRRLARMLLRLTDLKASRRRFASENVVDLGARMRLQDIGAALGARAARPPPRSA